MVSPFATTDGRVSAFDEHKGYGTVRDGEGHEWFFHCTRIAGGSRTIDPGAEVSFEVVAGPTGWEASEVRPRTR